ncbi:TetR family transcriptional regulator, partial [Streptomyces sp. NPDC001274]
MTEQTGQDARRPANDGPRAAVRNRAALVAAAREVFAEHGLEAPLSAIARRAGVGQGVLYRHFPDRAAAVAAVLEENVRQIERAAETGGMAFPDVLGVLTCADDPHRQRLGEDRLEVDHSVLAPG